MGPGHIGVAIGLKAAAPQRNVGGWVFCAFLCDFLLGVFAWLGWEHASGFADYPRLHYLTFTFPYSHGFLATVVWSAAAAMAVFVFWRDARTATVTAAGVCSHFILDALVHVQGLPLAGQNSPKISLALWRNLPVAVSVELVVVAAGIFFYLRAFSGKKPARAWTLAGVLAVLAVVLLAGQAFGTSVPDAEVLPRMWMGFPLGMAVVFGLLDPRAGA